MNETQRGSQGRCAIYGCPLFGSVGRGDEWVCFCHYDASASDLQAITTVLRRHRAVGETTTDIRLFYGSADWASAYRGIQRRLLEAGMPDMLPCAADCQQPGNPVVRQWLARLEGYLLHACEAVKSKRPSHYTPHIVPTAPVIGPTSATGFMPYRDNETVREE